MCVSISHLDMYAGLLVFLSNRKIGCTLCKEYYLSTVFFSISFNGNGKQRNSIQNCSIFALQLRIHRLRATFICFVLLLFDQSKMLQMQKKNVTNSPLRFGKVSINECVCAQQKSKWNASIFILFFCFDSHLNAHYSNDSHNRPVVWPWRSTAI